MERSSLAAVWPESANLWLEPHEVEAAGPIARLLANGVFGSDVDALRGDPKFWKSSVILGREGVGFIPSLCSVSTLVTGGDIFGTSRRPVETTGIGSGNALLAGGEETL